MRITVQSARIMERIGAEEGFRLLSEKGFDGVDFGITRWFPSADVRANAPSPLDAPLQEVLPLFAPYKAAAEKYGVSFSQTHAPYPTWMPGNEAANTHVLKAVKTAIAVTGYLGSPYCVVHPAYAFKNGERPSAREEWEINRALYGDLIPDLQKHHVVCCLENMFSSGEEGTRFASVCSDFSLAAQWIDRMNAMAGGVYFAFCLDTGHCHLARQNLRHAIVALGKHLRALHIHDNSGHLDQHLSPYMGSADWEGFLAGLMETGYDGDLSFETFRVLDQYPPELMDACLSLIAETGRYFKSRLSAAYGGGSACL